MTFQERGAGLSLYQIEAELAQLCEERDRADSEGDREAVAVMDGLIAGYLTKEAAKVDNGAALIRQDTRDALLLRDEAARLIDRAKALESRAARVKGAWCAAMAAQGIKELKSLHNTIRRAGNGGARPLVVTDVAAVPRTKTIPAELVADWDAIRAALERGEKVTGCELGARGEHLRLS